MLYPALMVSIMSIIYLFEEVHRNSVHDTGLFGFLLFTGLGPIYAVWYYAQPVLLAMAVAYVGSGIVIRVGGIIRRRLRHAPPRRAQERQIG
jgi:hypothetical protein